MTKEQLEATLIKIHARYAPKKRRKSSASSQLCSMWSLRNPPDFLENTAPLNAICKALDLDIEEDAALELYDMTIAEAAEALYPFVAKNNESDHVAQ